MYYISKNIVKFAQWRGGVVVGGALGLEVSNAVDEREANGFLV